MGIRSLAPGHNLVRVCKGRYRQKKAIQENDARFVQSAAFSQQMNSVYHDFI
ncbi:hypothetical protein [Endozoicomonas sp. 2B-B]